MELPKTWVVECYVPGVDDGAVQASADRAAREVARLGLPAERLEYLGALLMNVDEVVLHAFRAGEPELVRRVSAAAGLSFARIVESVEVLPGRLIQPNQPQPAAVDVSSPALLQPRNVPL